MESNIEGYDIGTERQVLIDPRLREAGKLGALILQPLGQLESLRTVYHPRSPTKAVDIGAQLFVESGIIRAIDGHVGSDFTLWDGAEVDARYWPVGQDIAEIALFLLDGCCSIPIETDAHLFCNRLRTYTRLTVTISKARHII